MPVTSQQHAQEFVPGYSSTEVLPAAAPPAFTRHQRRRRRVARAALRGREFNFARKPLCSLTYVVCVQLDRGTINTTSRGLISLLPLVYCNMHGRRAWWRFHKRQQGNDPAAGGVDRAIIKFNADHVTAAESRVVFRAMLNSRRGPSARPLSATRRRRRWWCVKAGGAAAGSTSVLEYRGANSCACCWLVTGIYTDAAGAREAGGSATDGCTAATVAAAAASIRGGGEEGVEIGV